MSENNGAERPWNPLQNVGPQGLQKAGSGVAFRLYLQSLVRELLPDERTALCLRRIVPEKFSGDGEVKVFYSPGLDGQGRVFLKNLLVCSMIWICPVCSSKVTEGRRMELGEAVEVAAGQGLYATMLTFTVRHKKGDRLSVLLEGLRASFQAFHAGRWAKAWREQYGIVGHSRGLEVTYGDHGWHPHYHELLFMTTKLDTPALVDAFQDEAKKHWLHVIDLHNLDADWEHGLHVRSDAREIAEYVAKYGHQPIRSKRWGVEHEIAKGAAKLARREGRSPFQLVADFGDGDRLAGDLFKEYWAVFKGQRQLYWSRGLKARFGIGEVPDGELADEPLTPDARLLASLSAGQWWVVLANDARGRLFEVARSGSVALFQEFLESLPGMEKYDPVYTRQGHESRSKARLFRPGWRVSWADGHGARWSGIVLQSHPATGDIEVDVLDVWPPMVERVQADKLRIVEGDK